MADDFYGYDEAEAEPQGHDNLFLWTVFILLLIGLAFACWMGSFWVFGHPEQPKAYEILKKLKKIDTPLRFEVTAAPPGEFLTAQKLFERYGRFTRLELENENAELIRNYIRNYRETKRLVTYVTGRYTILDSTELKPSDMFPSGMVALAQASEFPQVVVEHVFTTPQRNVSALRALLQTGQELKLERTNDLSAVIHIERIPDGRMQFTVVPLLYGSYRLTQGSGVFSLEPPPTLNMVPGLPVMKPVSLQEALQKFATYRRDHPLPSTGASNPTAPSATPKQEIVRNDIVEPGKPTPETGPLPEPRVATPMPIAGQPTPRLIASASPTPLRAPSATPRMNLTMVATPTPRPAPAEAPAGTPVPSSATPLPQYSPNGVKMQPFIAAQGDPNMGSNGASWRTYAPGQAPPAREVSLDEVTSLADRGETGERLYLRGEFRVTASGTSRAVLRDATRPDDQSPRIVVEYPAGAVPPQEKERFVRGGGRPYLINDIRRGADGVVTIYVKEIIKQ